ncbi:MULTISPECIES: tRNA (N6-threonylcarbamoyladenosine(37)-N6)-methyltransferase TrmO [Actinomadura]|uniref:tRNA (N6-threonylcarbamoyladenosine(37)-N6)-methyltransferase TrmO n=1 Tax=Actinomadura yumaensis TaxID=111807 RepID=A0ABW2CVW4_9ACTN|nr:tRNA (N6-threonylcarbamoyladenosine(37)-N6)-methyltransferase TrmO [Actinomadura sp. J1-007]MWK39683.1 tRNA (N6-threonylcarbamoyladenosine(37)-N6)-methyltransferase TrmO [Actinomadura sp. J1-007]
MLEAQEDEFNVTPVGRVRSPLTDRARAPRQSLPEAPEAWLEFDPAVSSALDGLRAGEPVVLLTWLHLAARDVLRVHPRGDVASPKRGVFATRSPDRPNPVGLHLVEIAEVRGLRVRVRNLEAVDGTPILDVKPVRRGVPDF